MKKASLLVLPLTALFAAGAASGAPEMRALPMTRAAWEKYQPLGGEFEDGRYITIHEQAPAFEVARDFAPSSNIVVEATFTPRRKVGEGEVNASIAILESPGRYWHLFLAESRFGKRTFGFTELGGASQIQSTLPVLEKEGLAATWEWGRAYRLRITIDDGAATGEISDSETGVRLFRLRYGLAPGHVASGRPAFKFYRLIGDFEEIDCNRMQSNAIECDRPTAIDCNRQQSIAIEKSFYRTTRDASGKWWFTDPSGKPFFLSGIGVVSHAGHYSAALGYAPYARTVARKYPTLEDWATNTLSRLTSWGFNFLSSPSSILLRRGLPHAHVLGIGQQFATYGDEFDILPCDGGPCSGFPNVFHPLWPEYCRYRAEFVCAQDRDDPWTLGWYIDNELSWWGDKRKFTTPPASGLFDAAALKAPGHPARMALEAFLAEWKNSHKDTETQRDSLSTNENKNLCDSVALCDIKNVPVEVKREFVRLCARKYFEETTRAIHEFDPNHLILGCRFAGLPSADPVVWEECGRFCDVVSVNIYPMADLDRGVAVDWPGPNAQLISDILGERVRIAGKPAIITEWCFSALDSGLPCTHGAGQRFFTQKERAKATSIFASTMWAMPECAGYVYFMWCDQPAVGKNGPQSENTNYGLVNADDEPYQEQVAALAALQCNPGTSRAADVPKPHKVMPPEAEDFAAMAAVAGGNRLQSIAIENGSLLVGGKGVFSTMLREYSRGHVLWTAATEVAGVVIEKTNLSAPTSVVSFRGVTASGPFEVAIRFYEPPGREFFIAELLSVRNCGTAPLPFESVFFRLMPVDEEGVEAARGDDVFEPPKEGQPTPIPPSLWRPWGSGAWILPDGTVLGFLSPRTTGVIIRFWRDPALHSDAQMHYPRYTLAPGETWTPDYHPFVIGGMTSGGESGWRAFCDRVKAAEEKK